MRSTLGQCYCCDHGIRLDEILIIITTGSDEGDFNDNLTLTNLLTTGDCEMHRSCTIISYTACNYNAEQQQTLPKLIHLNLIASVKCYLLQTLVINILV